MIFEPVENQVDGRGVDAADLFQEPAYFAEVLLDQVLKIDAQTFPVDEFQEVFDEDCSLK